MAPRYNLNHDMPPYPFMTCVVKVSTQSYNGRGERTVAKVLNKCHGVQSFRMNGEGTVEISGTVSPSVLLKMLGRAGRSAELSWFQFGECSNNLFMPSSAQYHDGRYLHAPQPCYDHYYGNTGYSSYGSQLGYYGTGQKQHHDYFHGHGYRSSNYNEYDTQERYQYRRRTRSYGGDAVCCTIM